MKEEYGFYHELYLFPKPRMLPFSRKTSRTTYSIETFRDSTDSLNRKLIEQPSPSPKSVMTIIELLLFGVHCHTKFPKERGPQNIFRIFEAHGSRAHQNSRKMLYCKR